MKLFTFLFSSLALLRSTVTAAKQCCSGGADPSGIPYSTFSGRVCRNIGDNGFRMEPLVYQNDTLTWESSFLGCKGNATSITHYDAQTEFRLNAIEGDDPRCDGAVLTIYSQIRAEAGDFKRVKLVLGDGTNCGIGPLQLACEPRACCAEGCQEKPEASSGGRSALCLSESATVEVFQGGLVALKDLQLGDRVKTSTGYEPVYSFGHHDLESSADFLAIHTSNNKRPLEITKDHLLFLRGQVTPVPAGSVRVGDRLQTQDKEGAIVTKIGAIHKQGLYAPLTASGTVVVDGVLASSYVTLQGSAFVHFQGIKTWLSQERFVHVLLSPHRLLCMGLFPALGETYTVNGMPIWVDYGIQYIQTAHNQSFIAEAIMLLAGLFVTGLCFLLEHLFGPSLAPLAVACFVYYCKNIRKSSRAKQVW